MLPLALALPFLILFGYVLLIFGASLAWHDAHADKEPSS